MYNNNIYHWNGYLDDFRVYNKILEYAEIYELAKLELTEISKSYLMEFIATQLDLLNDEETEENKDVPSFNQN